MKSKDMGYKNILVVIIALLTYYSGCSQNARIKRSVYVIVHGAWGGSWAFKKVDSLLTAQGHIVYRPSLTGQGERVHLSSPQVNLTTHIHDVVNTIRFEDLRDIILVGHSYGGMVITGAAEYVADRIKRMIYLDAIFPKDGETVLKIMDPNGDRLKPMVKGDFLVPPWVKDDQKVPRDVPHPLNTFTEPIVLKNKDALKVPVTYILTVDRGKKAEADEFFPSSQRAQERGCNFYQMNADHNPQWSAPKELVAMLLKDL